MKRNRPHIAGSTLIALALLLCAPIGVANAARLGPLPASYSGVLPCADCIGLSHHLNLFPGGGYVLALTHFRDGRDETFYDIGWYEVSSDSATLALMSHDPEATRFALRADGVLRKLDRAGSEIESKLPYELVREPGFTAIEPRLTLHGSYTYSADAGVFTECRSGLRFPVAPGPDSHLLEKAFLNEQSERAAALRAAEPSRKGARSSPTRAGPLDSTEARSLVVAINARIASRPPAGMEGDRPTLIVEHLIETFPNESCGARGVTHPLEGTRWVLTRMGAEGVRLWPGQHEIFLVLDAKAGRVTGFSGCNRFSGAYTRAKTDGERLDFGPAAATRMACVGPNYETQLFRTLELTQSFHVTDAHLELFDSAGEVIARFEARDLH